MSLALNLISTTPANNYLCTPLNKLPGQSHFQSMYVDFTRQHSMGNTYKDTFLAALEEVVIVVI